MTELFIRFLSWVYDVIFALLPDMPDVSAVLGNLSGNSDIVFDVVSQVNFVIPLDIITIIVALDLSIRIFFFILYVVNKSGKVVIKLLGIVF